MNSRYLSGRFSYKTDIGRIRLSNEDQAAAMINASGNVLLVVCDGMGGQNKGDLASSLAINTITTSFKSRKGFLNRYFAKLWVGQVIREANKSIYEQSQSNKSYHGMGTTITLLLIIKDTAILGHVGDSRCYFIHPNVGRPNICWLLIENRTNQSRRSFNPSKKTRTHERSWCLSKRKCGC